MTRAKFIRQVAKSEVPYTLGWQLSDLPELRPGDWAYVRTNSIPSAVIRFLFRSYYNHVLWIAQIFKYSLGVLQIGIIESIGKGMSPGDLWSSYYNADIVIMRADCDDEMAGKSLAEAYKYGRKRYDWLIGLDVIRLYGCRKSLGLLIRILRGKKVLFPHIKDRRVVCIEGLQEPYQDAGFPLIDEKYLLSPNPTSSEKAHAIFYGFHGFQKRR